MYRLSGTLTQLPCKGVLVLLLGGLAGLGGNLPAAHAAPSDGLQGPDVTIIAQEEKTIYEFRQGGQLRMIKVVPNWGKPYYLVPRDRTRGFGDLERSEMWLPSWVIIEF